jgi:diaminopimelate decarboxylase
MPSKFGGGNAIKTLTHIDGVSTESLLEKFGSPLFVLSEKIIRRNYREAHRAFSTRLPRVQFSWSYKSNYLDAVCRIFHQEGSWAEVVSGFEYQKALLNGVPGDKIIFNGPDKTRDDLILATRNQSLIHIDHFDELYLLQEVAKETHLRPQVAIRVNMDTGIYPMWDRFGFNYENGQAWDAINRIVKGGQMDLVGLHCHIGTFIMTADAYEVAATKLASLALETWKQLGVSIAYLDLGGGFASKNTLKGAYLPGNETNPDFDDYAEAITRVLMKSSFPENRIPLIILETGRALIDNAGYLLGTVIANKRSSTGKKNLIVDFGVNILFTAFWYNHPLLPLKTHHSLMEECTVYGPLCMNIDVIRDSVVLPALNPGDHLAALYVGAYNMTQWMQFITMRPAVVLITEKGEPVVIRKAETDKVIREQELIPDHLLSFTL